MNATLRNVLWAALAAIMVGFVLGELGDMVNAPTIGESGRVLAVSIGILLFFILHLRRANRASHPADADARARALSFICPHDHALVYFVRTGLSGAAVGVDIDIDDRTVAQVRSPRFTCLTLTPGTHSFKAHVGNGRSSMAPAPALLSISLGTGSVTLLHVAIRRSVLKTNLVFEPWTLDMAKARLGRMTMVLPESTATGSPT